MYYHLKHSSSWFDLSHAVLTFDYCSKHWLVSLIGYSCFSIKYMMNSVMIQQCQQRISPAGNSLFLLQLIHFLSKMTSIVNHWLNGVDTFHFCFGCRICAQLLLTLLSQLGYGIILLSCYIVWVMVMCIATWYWIFLCLLSSTEARRRKVIRARRRQIPWVITQPRWLLLPLRSQWPCWLLWRPPASPALLWQLLRWPHPRLLSQRWQIPAPLSRRGLLWLLWQRVLLWVLQWVLPEWGWQVWLPIPLTAQPLPWGQVLR